MREEERRRNKRGNGRSLRYLCDCKTCDFYSERDEGSTLKSIEQRSKVTSVPEKITLSAVLR